MQNHKQVVSNQQPQKLDRSSKKNPQVLPPIPDKLYFTIGEASNLCLVKPHVLRYWEKEFPQLSPMKRRGSRRYYQRAEILLVRRIKSLLYEQGFTIEGARTKLSSSDENNSESATLTTKKLAKSVISRLNQVLLELD